MIIIVVDYNYCYMFEKLFECSEVLDDLIDEYVDVIKDVYGILEFGDFYFVFDESIYIVGRVLFNIMFFKSDKVVLKNFFYF